MVRTLLALALVLVACGPSDRRDDPAAYEAASSVTSSRGPDPLVLRIPRRGGAARVYPYPGLDTVLWRSRESVPTPERVLAFDVDGGQVALVDQRGRPIRLDLRLGTVRAATRAKLTGLTSSDGSTIYGITDSGTVSRLTPSGTWSFAPPLPARQLFPQRDGSLLVLADAGPHATVWRLHPPEPEIGDTAVVENATAAVRTQIGDRLYFTVKRSLVGVRSRDLTPVTSIRLRRTVQSMLPSPSGDRLYVLADSGRMVVIVDRYQEEVGQRIELPGRASELRIDPLGRFLLARMAERDSAWVLAVGTDRLVGGVATDWRSDLPFVGPDGRIALAVDSAVVFVHGATLRQERVIRNGARDFWYSFFWNGFRPRAAELDQPVTFTLDDTAGFDTLGGPPLPPSTSPADSITRDAPPPARRESTTVRPAPPPRRSAGFLVQFAALLSEPRAREMAREIRVDGRSAHVVTSTQAGATIYRVVLGPFPTRRTADEAGRESGRSYWVFEATP